MISRSSRFVSLSFILIITLLITAGCQTPGVHELLPYRPTDYEEIERRLEAGANPNARNHEGRTLLWRAALRGDERLVEILLKYGADPARGLRVKDGETPMHIAADRGHDKIVRVFLDHGVDVNIQSRAGRTPLHMAAMMKRESTVALLLQNGADPMIRTGYGRTPLTHTGSGRTALNGIGFHGEAYGDPEEHLPVVKLLVEAGVPIDVEDNRRTTPLFDACSANNQEVVIYLLSHGANPNHKDENGFTPLMIAAARADSAIVRLLLEEGADVDAANVDGRTAVSFAEARGENDILELLRR